MYFMKTEASNDMLFQYDICVGQDITLISDLSSTLKQTLKIAQTKKEK